VLCRGCQSRQPEAVLSSYVPGVSVILHFWNACASLAAML